VAAMKVVRTHAVKASPVATETTDNLKKDLG
jgi:hypothetical protein